MATKNKNKHSQSGSGEYSRVSDLLKVGHLGRYEIKKKLGAGGMGAVYLALDPQLNRLVALKILPPDKAENATLVKRFRAEAQSVAQLMHDHIVRIYESGELDGYMYIALEYVEGTDVQRLIRKRGRLPVRRATEIIKQVTLALEHASESGIVHRDIKPANLLITQSGVVKLTDLGLARALDDEETSITRDGTTVGTVDYMSPEQGRSSKAADIRSDLYSLGCTWYHMLTGTPPYPEGNITNKLHAHATAPIPDPRSINESIPESIVGVIARLMAKKPVERYQSAHELLEDLEAVKKNSRSEISATDLAALASPGEIEDEEFESPNEPTSLPQRSKKTSTEEASEETGSRSKTSRRAKKVSSGSSKSNVDESGKNSLPPRERKKLSEVDGKKEGGFDWTPFIYTGVAIGVLAFAGLLYSVISGFGGTLDNGSGNNVDLVELAEERQKAREEEVEKAKQNELANNSQPSNKQNNPNQQVQPDGSNSTGSNGAHISQNQNNIEAGGPQVIRVIASNKKTDATSAHTLKEAIEKVTASVAVVEIQTEGLSIWEHPVDIFEKKLTLRAGNKSSGLILVNTTGALAEGFLRVRKGSLKMQGLHFGLLGYDLPGDNELVLIRAIDADLDVRDCSFTLEENRRAPVVLCQASWNSSKAGKSNWQRCLIRGTGWAPFSFSGRKIQSTLQESLVAIGNEPVYLLNHPPRSGSPGIDTVSGAEKADRDLSISDSIIACEATAIAIENGSGQVNVPSTLARLNRSVFVASNSVGTQPFLSVRNWPENILKSSGAGKLSDLKWISEETLISGWKQRLLASTSKTRTKFNAENDEQWVKFWGGQGLEGKWESEGINADLFSRLASLEPAKIKQYKITSLAHVDQKTLDKLTTIDTPELAHKTWRAELTFLSPPSIPQENPFVGEVKKLQVDLNKTDLGQFLTSQSLTKKTIIEAKGFGLIKCTPFTINNKQVKIQFISAKGKYPLTLQPVARKNDRSGKSVPWITVENGTLEIEAGVFRLRPPNKNPMPRHWIKSQNSTVRLNKCYVTAPFEKHERLSSLINISQPESSKRVGNGLWVERCYLQSGGDIISIDLASNPLVVRNSLLVSQNHLFDIGFQKKNRNQSPGIFEISRSTLSSRNGFFHFDLPAASKYEKPFVSGYVSESIFIAPVKTDLKNPPAVSLVSSSFKQDQLPRRLWWWGNRNGFAPEVAQKLMGQPLPGIWPEFWGPGHVESALFGADGVMLFNKQVVSKSLKPSAFTLFAKSKAAKWGVNEQPIGAEVGSLDLAEIAPGSQPDKKPTRNSAAPLF